MRGLASGFIALSCSVLTEFGVNLSSHKSSTLLSAVNLTPSLYSREMDNLLRPDLYVFSRASTHHAAQQHRNRLLKKSPNTISVPKQVSTGFKQN